MNALRAAIVRGTRRTPRRGDGVFSARMGDGYEFAQLRAYVEGDDPRRLDWAASARAGALQTRVFLEERALVLAAIIDDSPSMRVGRRRRISDAAGEALRAWFGAAEADDRTQRILGDRIVTDRRAALHVVSRERFDLRAALTVAASALARGTTLLAVTDAYDLDAGDDALLVRVARRCDATLLVARDPWYDGMPLRGLRRVRDAETGRTRPVLFTRRTRERFVAAVREREAALCERFAAAGWRAGVLDGDGRASLERVFGLRA